MIGAHQFARIPDRNRLTARALKHCCCRPAVAPNPAPAPTRLVAKMTRPLLHTLALLLLLLFLPNPIHAAQKAAENIPVLTWSKVKDLGRLTITTGTLGITLVAVGIMLNYAGQRYMNPFLAAVGGVGGYAAGTAFFSFVWP